MFQITGKKIPNIFHAALAAGLMSFSSLSLANWTLDDSSELYFLSVKANSVAEIHSFKTLTGTLSETGAVNVQIDLASVWTQIEIRDERMKNILFKTDEYPKATLSAQVDTVLATTLSPGQTQLQEIELTLDLHGKTQTFKETVRVTALEAGQLLVATTQPIVVNAAAFGLVDGVNALRDIAGLPSITEAVPVTATFIFTPEN